MTLGKSLHIFESQLPRLQNKDSVIRQVFVNSHLYISNAGDVAVIKTPNVLAVLELTFCGERKQ